jgi:hypothetical protein
MIPLLSQGKIYPVNEVQQSLFKTRLVLITLFLVFFGLALGLHKLFE